MAIYMLSLGKLQVKLAFTLSLPFSRYQNRAAPPPIIEACQYSDWRPIVRAVLAPLVHDGVIEIPGALHQVVNISAYKGQVCKLIFHGHRRDGIAAHAVTSFASRVIEIFKQWATRSLTTSAPY